jgi:hypothetical protein
MPGNARPTLLWNAALIAAGAIFVSYGVIFFFPSEGEWKVVSTDLFFMVAALWSTVTAALLWHVYRPDPGLRRIWFSFAVALGLWCLAEAIWTLQNVLSGPPGLGIADIFWVSGYLFFGIALYAQYKLLLIPPKWLSRAVFAAILLLSLAISFSFAFLLARSRGETLNLENWLAAFYPVGDLAIGAGALYIAYLFRGGMFSRPWLGMLLFAIADSLYAWMNLSQADYLLASGSLTLYVADSLYLSAYLAVGLACFMQWLILRYGFFYATKS